jgi:hypothetical protein
LDRRGDSTPRPSGPRAARALAVICRASTVSSHPGHLWTAGDTRRRGRRASRSTGTSSDLPRLHCELSPGPPSDRRGDSLPRASGPHTSRIPAVVPTHLHCEFSLGPPPDCRGDSDHRLSGPRARCTRTLTARSRPGRRRTARETRISSSAGRPPGPALDALTPGATPGPLGGCD